MFIIIKEMLPPDGRVARETQDLLVECCVGDKLTQVLGFGQYIEEDYSAYEQHRLETLDMEVYSQQIESVEEEEEYVLLDIDNVYEQIEIPPNAPYILSGLDTLNPVLTIGDNLKLIGEYEETVGTCYIFTESEGTPLVHEETGPSEENLFMGKCIEDPNQVSSKEVKPIAGLQKILKFRLLPEVDIQAATTVKPSTDTSNL